MTDFAEQYEQHVTRRDIALAAKLLAAAPMAWLLPEAAWLPAARGAARIIGLRKSARDRRLRDDVRKVLGERFSESEIGEILFGYSAETRLRHMFTMRCQFRRGWNPTLRLEGREHLEAALSRGHGAILWDAPFVHAPIMTKMAVHRAGFALTHLSRSSHPFSATRFGRAVLDPIQVRIENRCLVERVVIPPDGSTGRALRALKACLTRNGVVSITVGAQGARTVTAPCLGNAIRLASGPPNLARKTGAALLPVVTARDGPSSFCTTIAPPIVDGAAGEIDDCEVAARLARVIEHHTLRVPTQFVWVAKVISSN